MKKIFFSLSAVLFAAASFAQGIVLEHTFDGAVEPSSFTRGFIGGAEAVNPNDFDDCFYQVNNGILYWWDEDYTQHTIALNGFGAEDYPVIAARYIFTNDNRMCFLVSKEIRTEGADHRYYNFRIYDELGTIIQDFTQTDLFFYYVTRIFGEYKLIFVGDRGTSHTYVYSLPGQGKTATGNETIQSAPRRGRKYVQDAQVLVEENNRTYNTTGVRVK